MAYVVIEEQHLNNIGDSIRMKNGKTTYYKPREMADAIRELSALSNETLEDAYLSDSLVNFTYTHIPKIGNSAFDRSQNLSTVDTTGVIELGDYAFSYSSVNSVNLPNLTTMGKGVFCGTSLSSLNIPKITTLPWGTFSSYTGSTIPGLSHITEVGGDSCFDYSENLTSIDLPNLTTINGSDCFQGCVSLDTVNFPVLTTINGSYCFSGCSSVAQVNLPSLTTINGSNCFAGVGAETINLPNLTQILQASCTFTGCAAKTIILPSLSKISYARDNYSWSILMFTGCENLEALVLPSTTKVQMTYGTTMYNMTDGDYDVFYTNTTGGERKAYIYVPSSLLSSYQSDSNWTKYYNASVFRAIEDYPEIGALL